MPTCDNNETQYNETFVDWAIPEGDQCHVRKLSTPNSTTCEDDGFINETTTCTDWVYDTSMFTSTTVTEASFKDTLPNTHTHTHTHISCLVCR